MPHDEQVWLCPEIEGASVDDGTENVAGCQNADRVTEVVDDRNRIDLFIEHGVGDLSDLSHRSGGQDLTAHDTCELVPGDGSRRTDRFQLM
jgi:hypothetical protein